VALFSVPLDGTPKERARHADRKTTCVLWVKRTKPGNTAALEDMQSKITKIQMMLHGLIRSLKQKLK
jgi:hypothetical protein